MIDARDLYPPNPADIPADLTSPTPSYRARVFLVLACLLFFVVVYVSLTIGSAGLAFYSLIQLDPDKPKESQTATPSRSSSRNLNTSRTSRSEGNPFVWIVLGISSGLLFLFLAKGLFRISRGNVGLHLEVAERDQPELHAFIRRLCQDTRAPFPHRIYVTPDVNAAVFYHQSIVNLILPSRKNLIIVGQAFQPDSSGDASGWKA